MSKLTDKLQSKLASIYEEQTKKLNRPPSQSELFTNLQSLDPSYQRMPPAILNKYIKDFYNSLKKIIPPPQDEEPEIQKKQKPNQPNQPQTQQNGNQIQSVEPALILKFPKLDSLGGLNQILPLIESLIYIPLKFADQFDKIGISAPKGILLTGTTGCGKTALAQAICRDLHEKHDLKIYMKHGAEFVGSLSGESEKNIRQLFENAQKNTPSVIFLDDIDVIAGSRDKATKEMERRVVTQMLACLDQLPNNVFLIAATSHPDYLDAGLRRSGRFDKEIMISVPNDEDREDILVKILQSLKYDTTIDIRQIARRTPGYVASDLHSLCREAGVAAVRRYSQVQQEDLCIEQIDFEISLKTVQPTAKREGFAVIPDVSWEDIGSLQELRKQLYNCIVLPIQNPEIFKKFSVRPPAGVLLWGPPGCGKTLLAKAVANASRANFIAIKGPELLNKYVGESEKAIRNLFTRAKASQPCIIFFDEMDAICPIRGNDGGNQVTERMVNQLLTELDGFEESNLSLVFIIAATNRPDILDPALLRPGRIDKPLYVPLPDYEGRIEILKALSRKSPLDVDVNFEEISKDQRSQNLTGADLANLLTQSALNAIINNQDRIEQSNILSGLQKLKGSIQENDRRAYEKLRQKWQSDE